MWAAQSPVVDGRGDDPVWRTAPVYANFQERKPNQYGVAPVRTTYRAAFDADAVYVLVECDDDHPEAIQDKNRTRDSFAIFADDAVSLKFDPGLDRRTTLGFATNPGGAKMDYRGINETDFRTEFDAVWQVATSRGARGWVAEFRIPFTALGIDPASGPDTMGFQISRDHARRNATYDWKVIPRPYSAIAASRYGRLTGFGALRGRVRGGRSRWSVTPYVLGGFERDKGQDGDVVFKGGLDVSFELGGGWRGQLTAFTDFAQVDLDDQAINLTRFGLFFPEKRAFFLDAMELFVFGVPGETQLLHTRRIGLRDGRPVPLISGLKLVGRAGKRIRVGVLQATTTDAAGRAWTSDLVGRTVVELGRGSYLGLMLSHRHGIGAGDPFNVVLGLDGALRAPGVPLLVEAFAMLAFIGERGGELVPGDPIPVPSAARLAFEYRGKLVRPSLALDHVSSNFEAGLGFVQRTAFERLRAGLVVEPRPSAGGLERIPVEAHAELVLGPAYEQLLDALVVGAVNVIWNSGWSTGLTGGWRRETVTAATRVGTGVAIAAGTYEGADVSANLFSPGTWPASFFLQLGWRDYFGGSLVQLDASLTVRANALVRVEAGGTFSHAEFSDQRGGFDTGILNTRVAFGFTPVLGLDLYAGWSGVEELVRGQARLRWTWMPGSDLFLVYQADLGTVGRLERFQSVLLKASVRLD